MIVHQTLLMAIHLDQKVFKPQIDTPGLLAEFQKVHGAFLALQEAGLVRDLHLHRSSSDPQRRVDMVSVMDERLSDAAIAALRKPASGLEERITQVVGAGVSAAVERNLVDGLAPSAALVAKESFAAVAELCRKAFGERKFRILVKPGEGKETRYLVYVDPVDWRAAVHRPSAAGRAGQHDALALYSSWPGSSDIRQALRDDKEGRFREVTIAMPAV